MSLFPPSPTITFEAALADLRAGSPRARVAAAQALGGASLDDDAARQRAAVTALLAALGDDRAEVRAAAAAALGDRGDAAAVEPLAARLGDGDPAVRQHAAIALGTLGAPAAFAPLAAALRDGPADLRFQAASSLAEVDPAAAVAPLVAAATDRDAQVRAAVALALGAAAAVSGEAGDAAPTLATLLDDADGQVRFDAAYALAELGDGRGREVLARRLDEPDGGWDAAEALERLGDAEAAAALASVLGARRADPAAVLRAAGGVLRLARAVPVAAGHAEAARRVLLAGLDARKLHLRGLAVQQLASAGDLWAVEPLRRLAASRRGRPLADDLAETLRALAARREPA